ncbi:unnamed protein product [Phaedon cochleariae]|uniref:C-type lectin domain-containing protein n=1 Tax=Phaedon cochleariae TaxID=80249 RepID=A0A9N9SFM3_PHACE|nr:unnamed protein product [Phaedon cochleariae]
MWLLSITLLLSIFCHYAQCEATLDDKYYLGRGWMSYTHAVQTCQSRSMKLVSIENKEKNDEISELMRQKDIRESCWVSGRTLPDRRTWVWLDGTPFKYQNWNPRRIRYGHYLTDNCLTVARQQGDLYWDDQICHNLRCYICEYPSTPCNQQRIKIRIDDHLNATSKNARNARIARRKEFSISSNIRIRDTASRLCQSMDMELANIYNEIENNDMDKLLNGSGVSFWSSGYRTSATDYWKWSPEKNVTFTSWQRGEPNNANYQRNEFCIRVRSSGGMNWYDQSCSDSYRFICQRIVPKVDILVNGNNVVKQEDTVMVPAQFKPFQVIVDFTSAPPTDTRDHIDWDYFISEDKVNQSDAKKACEKRSQHLLTIENKEKNELVFKLLEKHQVPGVYWTSASRNSTKSQWNWGNRDPVIYSHWGRKSTNVNVQGETCLVVNKTEIDVTWSNLPCTESRQYICETTKVSSVNKAGGTLLDVVFDDKLVYSDDSTLMIHTY